MANPSDRTDAIETFSFAQSVILAVLILASIGWFKFLARQLAWPMEAGYSPSILASIHPLRGFIVVIIGSGVGVFAGSLFFGRIKPDAGLMLAACGLAYIAAVAGPVGSLVRLRQSAHPIGIMLGELSLLFLIMLFGWCGQRLLGRMGLVRRWPTSTDSVLRDIVAGGVQAVLAGVMVSILAQDDAVKQAMASVFLASLLGTVVVQGAIPVITSTPLWIGTLIGGLVQFAWAGAFGHVVTVSPLAYASLGVAGSIAGFWASHRWNIILETPTTSSAADSL
jgi:hypothetical protein